jgi:hypothetical protein
MPVSMTATLTLLAPWTVVASAAAMRRIPVGGSGSPAASDASAWTIRSGLTKSTSGSDLTLASWPGDSLALKPFTACAKRLALLNPSRRSRPSVLPSTLDTSRL